MQQCLCTVYSLSPKATKLIFLTVVGVVGELEREGEDVVVGVGALDGLVGLAIVDRFVELSKIGIDIIISSPTSAGFSASAVQVNTSRRPPPVEGDRRAIIKPRAEPFMGLWTS